jgi:Undecaprenyl-phosphate glucose phosphotransferase
VFDFFTVAGAGIASRVLWDALKSLGAEPVGSSLEWVLPTILCTALVAPFVLRDGNVTTLLRLHDRSALFGRLAARFAVLIGVLLFVGYATHTLDTVPRGWFALWAALALVVVVASRLGTIAYVSALERRGIVRDVVAIVGTGRGTDQLIRHLTVTRGRGVEIVGVFDDRGTRHDRVAACPVGNVAALVELGKSRHIDWIVLNLPVEAERRIDEICRQVKALASHVALAPFWMGARPLQRAGMLADEIPVALLAARPLNGRAVLVKRATDLLLGGMFTLFALPILLLVALAVRLDSPGPVLFRQRRHGWNNQEFEIYKFRTMTWRPQADAPFMQTARFDARITRVGRFLRRTSLDELPQLFNVLRGDMSLVGPRPHATDMLTQDLTCYQIVREYAHRHRMRPGMTGWAQVHGLRGATMRAAELRRRVEYDLEYIDKWSLALDLKILWRTCFIVVGGRNAF